MIYNSYRDYQNLVQAPNGKKICEDLEEIFPEETWKVGVVMDGDSNKIKNITIEGYLKHEKIICANFFLCRGRSDRWWRVTMTRYDDCKQDCKTKYAYHKRLREVFSTLRHTYQKRIGLV